MDKKVYKYKPKPYRISLLLLQSTYTTVLYKINSEITYRMPWLNDYCKLERACVVLPFCRLSAVFPYVTELSFYNNTTVPIW